MRPLAGVSPANFFEIAVGNLTLLGAVLIFGAAFLRRQARRRIVGGGSAGGICFGWRGVGCGGVGAALCLAELVPVLSAKCSGILGRVILGAAFGHGQRIGWRGQEPVKVAWMSMRFSLTGFMICPSGSNSAQRLVAPDAE